MKRAYADIPEGQMHYRHAGCGEAVIMLHMSGSSSQEYERVGNLLCDKFSVYAIDLLGFGSSDMPPKRYSLAENAETVKEFMDAVGIEKAYFVGNLVGCNIIARFAMKYPEKVLGIMFGQYCFDLDYRHFLSRRQLPCFDPITPKEDGSHLMEMWARANKYDVPAQFTDERAACLHMAGDHGEWLHLSLFEEDDFTTILPYVTAPCAVIAYGKFAECDNEKYVAKMLPNAVWDEIPHATPYIPRSDPQAFADMFVKHFYK